MGAFKELNPDLVRELLKGQEDLISPETRKEQALFRNTSCPTCGAGQPEAVVNTKSPFTSGMVLPNKILRCLQCKSEFDPYTRIILSAPIFGPE